MPMAKNLEFKVGLFVFIALVGLTMFVFSITDSPFAERGRSLRVVFGFANGLKKSAPVRVAGVDEGIIKDINLFFDSQDQKMKARIEFSIRKDIKIPKDSTVMINQLGLMGEKYVEITPGVDTTGFWQDGQEVVGTDPIAQEAISQKIMDVAGKMDTAVAGFSKIINDDKNKDSISATFENLSLLTGNMNTLMMDVKKGKGTLGKFFYDERLYDDLQEMMADLKQNPWKLLYRPKQHR